MSPFKNCLEITITALRISADRSSEPIGSDLPIIKDALGNPLIAGASFKRALRSRLKSFLRGIDPSFAEDRANFTSSTRNNQVKALKEQVKMAFSSYKTIGEVLKAFQVIYTEANFIGEAEFNVSDYFCEDLEFTMPEGSVDCSELAICENLIFPVLKQVCKLYSSKFIRNNQSF